MFNLFIFCIFFQSSLWFKYFGHFLSWVVYFITGFWEVFISLNLTFMNLLNGSCYMTTFHLHKSIWQRSENIELENGNFILLGGGEVDAVSKNSQCVGSWMIFLILGMTKDYSRELSLVIPEVRKTFSNSDTD